MSFKMPTRRIDILSSPGFLISLWLLLLNDFYLKPLLNNPLTGKLSDFAGLFAFALFWIAVFPGFRRGICITVALSFAFWKTTYSQPVVDLWNSVGIVQVSRTVDLTDLIALAVLPLGYYYANQKLSITEAPKWIHAFLVLIAMFAFTATSYRTAYDDYDNKYYFTASKAELFQKIDDLRLNYFDRPLTREEKESGKLDLEIPSKICSTYFDVDLEVIESGGQTVVSIKKLGHRCPGRGGDRAKLL